MKKFTAVLLLLIIFFLTFFSRTIISLQTDEFSYEAYFALRQIENINQEGFPLFDDPLSYGGRTHLFPPLFYYLVAFFSFLGTGLAAKIIPNLLSSLVVVAVYLISYHITKLRSVSLISSFFSGFIPIFFVTINDLSVYSLVVLVMLFALYFIMRIEENLYLKLSLLFIVILVFSHASAFLLIAGLLLFLLLLRVESLEVGKKETELILFTSFLVLWFNFIIYKKAFLIHGPLVIWRNIPLQILTNYFFDLNIIQSIYYVGIVPIVFGIYAIYHVLFITKRRSVFMVLSMFLSILLLLWLKLVEFKIGLIFLSLMLVLLSSHSIKLLYSYFRKTKAPHSAKWFLVGVCLVFVLTAVIPSFNLALSSLKAVPSDSELKAMEWLKDNTGTNDVVLARLEEGYMINYFANRKTVIDQDFLLVEDSQQRYEDVQSVFSLRLKTEAVRRLNKYGVDYLYFSGKFGTEEKIYYTDPDCFDLAFNESIKIYRVHCSI
ncbi:hypothetical protein HQ533_02500 [Candidatus Woesearchaeota archaeon]|nr:hypothetical protein [Candidatus Woesearchaeota archaeon]